MTSGSRSSSATSSGPILPPAVSRWVAGTQEDHRPTRRLGQSPDQEAHALDPEDVGNLVRVGDHARGSECQNGLGPARRLQQTGLDMYMGIDQTGHQKGALQIEYLGCAGDVETGDVPGRYGHVPILKAPGEDVDHPGPPQQQVGWPAALRRVDQRRSLETVHRGSPVAGPTGLRPAAPALHQPFRPARTGATPPGPLSVV